MTKVKLYGIEESQFEKDGIKQVKFNLRFWCESLNSKMVSKVEANKFNLDKFKELKDKEFDLEDKDIFTKEVNQNGRILKFYSIKNDKLKSLGFDAKTQIESLESKYN